jgi:hypothetical protein
MREYHRRLLKLIALLVLCTAFAGPGQDRQQVTSHAGVLQQEPVSGR